MEDSPLNTPIKYFGYGSNKDFDMMVHMVGRKGLIGTPGKLFGYELCIQKLQNIRNQIPSYSSLPVSPQEVIRRSFGETFELYMARPKPDGVVNGTIWELSTEELELVKEWEMVEYGMQEEVSALAANSRGEIINVETQAVVDPPAEIDRVVTQEDYPAYIVEKEKMLSVADEVRASYLERIKKREAPPANTKGALDA